MCVCGGGFSPCSLVSAVLSPAVLFCTELGSDWCATSSPAIVTAEDELEEEAATVAAEEDEGACLETPPVAPALMCLDGLRWLPAAGLLE